MATTEREREERAYRAGLSKDELEELRAAEKAERDRLRAEERVRKNRARRLAMAPTDDLQVWVSKPYHDPPDQICFRV